jgi:hypothetical protein
MKSSYTLILANLVPLVGVMFFKWDLSLIMPLYWFENVVIGYFNIKKILKSESTQAVAVEFKVNGAPINSKSKGELATFFAMHYGIFTVVHGVFVFVLFATGFHIGGFILGACSLFMSHRHSYITNYLEGGEYLRLSPSQLFVRPYARVIVLHITILGGAWIILSLEDQFIPLVIFTMLKIVVDLLFHKLEHKKKHI